MPLPYDSLSLPPSDKHAVVLDIGAAFTKVGFAGESAPRCIIRTRVIHPVTKEKIFLYELQEQDFLFEALSGFIHELYFRHLLVSPKDRNVVFVESVLGTTFFRDTVAKVFFEQYEVSSVCFTPCHLMPLLTLGVPSAVVVDCGYRETTIVPICDGIPYLSAWQAWPMGSSTVHKKLEQMLLDIGTMDSKDSKECPISSSIKGIDELVLEDIKVKACFVTTKERADKITKAKLKVGDIKKIAEDDLPSPAPMFEYNCGSDKLLYIKSFIRENAMETYFELDTEEKSICTMILDSILLCPVDLRKIVASNIVIMGGGCMVKGFKHRVKEELNYLITCDKYSSKCSQLEFKFHEIPSKENCAAWLGSAIFGELDILPLRSLSRDKYNATKHVPDWCDFDVCPE